jgi:hypothetical protein
VLGWALGCRGSAQRASPSLRPVSSAGHERRARGPATEDGSWAPAHAELGDLRVQLETGLSRSSTSDSDHPRGAATIYAALRRAQELPRWLPFACCAGVVHDRNWRFVTQRRLLVTGWPQPLPSRPSLPRPRCTLGDCGRLSSLGHPAYPFTFASFGVAKPEFFTPTPKSARLRGHLGENEIIEVVPGFFKK